MYNNYIFDLYGTLIDINTDESNPLIWQKLSVEFAKYGALYDQITLKEQYIFYCKEEEKKLLLQGIDYPEIDVKEVFKLLLLKKNIKISDEEIKALCIKFRISSTKYIKLYDGVIDLLETLKNSGKKIYLLSNAQAYFTEYELDKMDIRKYFDGIVLSSNVKIKKPSSSFYKYLFDKYNLKKNESIMIGNDEKCDIIGAHTFGIDSLYIFSNISPLEDKNIVSKAKYSIKDGNVYMIKQLICK